MWSRTSLWAMVLSLATMTTSYSISRAPFKLRLLHTNDMHARFEQVSQSTGKCSEYEAAHNLCYGGFARVQGALNDEFALAENETIPVLSLNAGDTYQGTVWYAVYKWKVVSHFLKMLKIDAMCLGNHEFDDGIKGLVPFLNDVNIPVLAANTDFSEEPEIMKTPIKKALTLNRGGRKIGVIGYLTPDTIMLADTGKSKFRDEIASLKDEAKRLKSMGVDIIFALGHSGYEMDLKIAEEVPDIDVVVGGHSHTFLYSGSPPDSDVPVNTYPVMVTQKNGRKVAMVQAYAFTKYLGKLDLTFDDSGELIEAKGNPILLNHKIKEDQNVLEELKKWQSNLNATMKESVGMTKVFLDGSLCRFYECNLGNLITDAYIHYVVKNHIGPFWTNAPIAIQQAGGIRASINATGNNGTITREDVITVMPFFSSLSVVNIQGKHLLTALEWSVTRYDINHQQGRGEFLQVSGLRVKYNMRKPPGSRVVSARVRSSSSHIPKFEFLQPEKEYNVIMPTFLFNGGDNFTMFKEHGIAINQLDTLDTDVAIKYIQEKGPIYNGLEDRIEIDQYLPSKSTSYSNSPQLTYNFVYLLLFVVTKFI